MKNGVIQLLLLILVIAVGGCSAVGEEKKTPEKAKGKPPVAVEATKVSAADVAEGIEVIGTLAAKFGADVRSEYTGIVTDVYVTEWVKVKKGDPLAKLDTREIEVALQRTLAAVEVAKANVLQLEVGENRANREYERAVKLKEEGLITQQALDDARTEKMAAAARIGAAKAQIRLAEEEVKQVQTRLTKTLLRSPRDGMVSLRNVNVGDFVGEMGAKAMFRIVDNRVLDLTVTVPSGEMASLRPGQLLTFSTDALPGKTFSGKVMFINPIVNEADRSIRVVAEVDNRNEQLKSGLFVTGRIKTGERKGVLKVPRAALLTWDMPGKKADLLVVQGDTARRRTVGTGAISGDRVEVTSGVEAGDLVVTRGGFNVKDGDKVNVTRINGEK
ncbi:MAG: efflux pump, family, rane fusion lipoprotein [Deltaproteobacteria bacterium]|nr:efflux pump, family, rane fusion lipoprotein [Deltaproteobacteria bacterium]